MSKKILCPFHSERTPSCVLYVDGYWCAGCGARGPLKDIHLKGIDPGEIQETESEDLEASLAAISELPKRTIRGLELHCDERSFYIVWPSRQYYKRRFFSPGKGPKYLGASGHSMPPFIANIGTNNSLIIVEGELNALSLALALPEFTVISPGGSGHFESKHTRKWLPIVLRNGTISTTIVICDEDIAGAKAAIDVLSELRTTRNLWRLVKRDANQVLQEDGREKLREEILKILQGNVEKSS